MKHKVKARSLAAFKTLMDTLRSELSMAGEIVSRVKFKFNFSNSWDDDFKATVWSTKAVDKQGARANHRDTFRPTVWQTKIIDNEEPK